MYNKALIFAPHPDDETLGCGGTILKLKESGCIIKIVLLTKGEIFDTNDSVRLSEFEKSLRILGVDDFIFLNYKDGKIPISGNILDKYLEIYNEFLPDSIFVPSLSDTHNDHVNVTRGILKALENNLKFNLLLHFYEVVNPINVNYINDISKFFHLKLKAFNCYLSQHNRYDYKNTIEGLAKLRGAAIGSNAGEGFLQFLWDGSSENFFVESPLISVIIRASKKYILINALDSLLEQNYKLFEVIIVWFGKDSLTLPEKYNLLDFKILKGKDNRSYNLNLGIKHSKGSYISFLDEDDIFYPSHLADLTEILIANREFDIVYSSVNVTKCKIEKRKVKKLSDIYVFNAPYEKGKFIIENYIPLNSLLVKSDVFKRINFSEEFDAYEDWIFLFDAENEGFNFFHYNKITCEYRIFGDDYRLSHIKKGYTDTEYKVRDYIFKKFNFSKYKEIINLFKEVENNKATIEKNLNNTKSKLNFYETVSNKNFTTFKLFNQILNLTGLNDISDEYMPYYFFNFLLSNGNFPFFSIILVVADPPPEILIETLLSIKSQIYPLWELIILNNNSHNDAILNILRFIKRDSELSKKIIIKDSSEDLTIPQAFNKASIYANGDYLVIIDHDDCLVKEALSELAINLKDKDYKFCYTDSYTIDINGKAYIYHNKPDWSPETLLSFNYINHLTVFHKKLWNSLKGYNENFAGIQDWEILLRIRNLLSENEILHLRKPLYGWRAHKGSTAYKISEKKWIENVAKKLWQEKISEIFKDKLENIEIKSNRGPGFIFPENSRFLPEINAIIPSKDNYIFLRNCINSVLKSKYPCLNIIIVDNGSTDKNTLLFLKKIEKHNNITVIYKKIDFNWAKMNNIGVEYVDNKESILLFLNDDILINDKFFLKKMIQPFIIEKVGIVGAVLKFPDGQIQHNGIITDSQWIAMEIRDFGNNNNLNVLRNVSAVTGACMMVRRKIFETIKFDENLPVNYNDVDFCLQARQNGWRIVNNPNATSIHYHMTTREKVVPKTWEIEYMRKKWSDFLNEKYYYNWENISEKSLILKV